MEININYNVCVSCITYNHASFIEDTMRGFCLQQTYFPVVYCIVDDFSSDGAQEVIMKFITSNFNLDDETIARREETNDYVFQFAQHKTNVNCYFAIFLLKYNHYKIKKSKRLYFNSWYAKAKYIAYCEGDDYWIDSLKLQKQCDILEQNQDVAFVYTNFQPVDVKSRPIESEYCEQFKHRSRTGYIFFDLLTNGNFVITCTSFFRREYMMHNFPNYYDYGRFLKSARFGRVVYLQEKTACYRNNPKSIMNTNKDSLTTPGKFIIYNELKECIEGRVCNELKLHKMFKPVIGYVLWRQILYKYSPHRGKLIILLLGHPSFIVSSFRGIIMKMNGHLNAIRTM